MSCECSNSARVTSLDFLFDSVAIRERQRSIRLHVADSIINNDDDSDNNMTLEEQLTAVDQRYMQYLFRPVFHEVRAWPCRHCRYMFDEHWINLCLVIMTTRRVLVKVWN